MPIIVGSCRGLSEGCLMDLAMPLAVVTPTLDAAVLHALAATTARASGAQVHRMAGMGSPDGVRRVLTRLQDSRHGAKVRAGSGTFAPCRESWCSWAASPALGK